MEKTWQQQMRDDIEPGRVESTKKALEEMGFEVSLSGTKELHFKHKDELVRFFPYTGWHTGKSIKDGRGFNNLKKQLL